MLCTKCKKRQATEMGLCHQCLFGNPPADHTYLTVSEFIERYQNQPFKGLFRADEAFLLYSEYLRDHIFTPCIIDDERMGDFAQAHRILDEWYKTMFFRLLEEKIRADSIHNPLKADTGYYETIRRLFSEFYRFITRSRTFPVEYFGYASSGIIENCLKKIIILSSDCLVYPGIEKKNTDISDTIDKDGRLKPDIIDKAGNFIDSGSAIFLLELFFLIRDEHVLENFISILTHYPGDELMALQNAPYITLNPWSHQKAAIERWNRNNNRGVVEMATATGKTLVGMMAIEWMWKHSSSRQVLIVCHSRVILNQWRREIIEKMGLNIDSSLDYKHPISPDGVTIQCETIQTVIKNPRRYRTNLLIIDEVHHLASPSFRKIAEVPHEWSIGLSADIGDDPRKGIIMSNFGAIVYKYSIHQALTDKVIPRFEWVVHPVYLDIFENMEFNEVSQSIIRLFHSVRYDTRTIQRIMGNEGRGISGLSDFIRFVERAHYNKIELPSEWRNLQTLILLRRQIIHKSQPKVERAIDLTRSLANDHKIIVFLMNIESCDEFYKKISRDVKNVFVVHSEIKQDPIDVINRFREAENGVLIGAQMLNEGIDIPSADIGINISFTKTRLQLIQRMGRILRKNHGKEPVFFQFIAIPNRKQSIEEIDLEKFADDLAWVQSTALAMNLDINVKWDYRDIIAYRDIVEKFIQKKSFSYDGPSAIGTIDVGKILSGFEPDAIVRMPKILEYFKGKPISDKQWVDIIKTAHAQKKGNEITKGEFLQIEKFWYLLILGERKAENITEFFDRVTVEKSDEYFPLPGLHIGPDGLVRIG